MGPNKFVHLTFALAGLLAAFVLSRATDWAWSYFTKPNDLVVNGFAILVAGTAAFVAYRNEKGVGGGSLDSLFQRATDVTTDPAQQRKAVGQIVKGGHDVDPLELQRRILAVQQAQFGVKSAINQTADAESQLGQATKTRADFVKRGVEAYKPYRQALEQTRVADERLKTAQDKASAAHTTYVQKLRQLDTTEKGFLGTLDKFLATFTRVAQVVTKPIFNALAGALDEMRKVLADPAVKAGLEAIGTAIGGVIRQMSQKLSTDEWRSAFATFAHGAASMISAGGRALSSFLTVLRVIALAALPSLIQMINNVADWFGRLASKPDAIRAATGRVVAEFKTWLSIAGNLASIVVGFIRAAAGQAGRLSGHVRDVTAHWARWINSKEGQASVRDFLRRAAELARQVAAHVRSVVTWLKDHLPAAAQTAKDAFRGVYNIVKKIVDAVRWIQNASTDVADALGLGASPKDVANVARNDLQIVNRGLTDLKKHLNPSQRKTIRQQVAEALQELLSNRGSVSRQIDIPDGERKHLQKILDRLQRRGFASGGYTGATGGVVHPREFVVREAITNAIGLDRLHALNAGISPAMVFAGDIGGGRGDQHNHFHIPPPLDAGKSIDPANTARLLQQAWEAIGGGFH